MTVLAGVTRTKSRWFYIQDQTTGAQFLVDTGAEISVMLFVSDER